MAHTLPQTTAELMKDLGRLRAERAEYERKMSEISDTITAFERVIAYRAGQPLPESTTPTAHPPVEGFAQPQRGDQQSLPLPARNGEWRRKLRGLTHLQALSLLAKENYGVVRVSDAKRILVEAGLTAAKPRNVSSHIYHTLLRSEQFERIAPGEFRLVEETVLGTPASAPHPPGIDFITVEDAREEPRPVIDFTRED